MSEREQPQVVAWVHQDARGWYRKVAESEAEVTLFARGNGQVVPLVTQPDALTAVDAERDRIVAWLRAVRHLHPDGETIRGIQRGEHRA